MISGSASSVATSVQTGVVLNASCIVMDTVNSPKSEEPPLRGSRLSVSSAPAIEAVGNIILSYIQSLVQYLMAVGNIILSET